MREMENLAVTLIEESFGVIVSIVAKSMFRHGPMNLSTLVKRTKSYDHPVEGHAEEQAQTVQPKLSAHQVRDSLVVLIHHNMVAVKAKNMVQETFQDVEVKMPTHAIYTLSAWRVLSLQRYSKFVDMTKSMFGKRESMIISELLYMGRATREEVLDAVAVRIIANRKLLEEFDNDIDNDPAGDEARYYIESDTVETSVQQVRSSPVYPIIYKALTPAFSVLENEYAVELVKLFGAKTDDSEEVEEELAFGTKKKATSTNAKKRKAAESISSASKKPKTSGSTASAAAVPVPKGLSLEMQRILKKKGKSGTSVLSKLKDSPSATSVAAAPSAAIASGPSVAAGSTPRLGKTETTALPLPNRYWRVSVPFFMHEMRVDRVAQFAQEKCGVELISVAIKELLAYSRSSFMRDWESARNETDLGYRFREMSLKLDTATVLSRASHQLRELAGHDEELLATLVSSCVELCSRPGTDVFAVDTSQRTTMLHGCKFPQVNVQFTEVIQILRKRCVFDIAAQRYGRNAARILRLLLTKGALEQKEVGDFAMLPAKVARSILYKLLQGGMVKLQEVPKRPDHNPGHTYYLWKADLDGAIQALGRKACRALFNCKLRRRAIMHRNQALDTQFRVLKNKVEDGEMTKEEYDKHAGIDSYLKLWSSLDKLDRAILRLDATCMLLTDLV